MSSVVKSIKSNLMNFVVNAITIFIMTPVLIRSMGDHNYGIFALATSIMGYMSILDLGLNPAISRYISKYSAIQDSHNTRIYYSASLLVLSVIGVIASVIMLALLLYDPQILAPADAPYEPQYTYALLILLVQSLFVFPRIALIATLNGRNLFHVHNNITIILSLVYIVVVLALINSDNGLVLVLLVGLVSEIIKTAYLYAYITMQIGLRFVHAGFDIMRSAIYTLVRFSSKSFIQGASFKLASHSDNMIIAGFLNASYIVSYSLPVALYGQIYTVVANINIVYLPVFTDLHTRGERAKLVETYLKSTRLITAISIFSLGSVLVLADNFISMWVGPDYAEKCSVVVPYLGAHGIIYLFNPLANQLVTAMNSHSVFAKLSVYEAALNIALSILLVNEYGLAGVALGTLLSCLIIKIFRTAYCMKLLSLSFTQLCINPVRKVVAPSLLPVAMEIYLDDMSRTPTGFVITCLTASALWFILMMMIGITKEERHYVWKSLSRTIQRYNEKA